MRVRRESETQRETDRKMESEEKTGHAKEQ